MIKIGNRFKHFKTGGYYTVTALFTWEPTKEPAVLYKGENGEQWGRPLAVFLEEVADPNDPEQKVRRFAPQEPAQPFRLYSLTEKNDERGTYFEVHNFGGELICSLQDGLAPMIALTFMSMSNSSPRRGDDYMAGVVNGSMHILLTKPQPV